jgi:hypothetical protein
MDGSDLIGTFLSSADVGERHETLVRAPAEVVFEVAEHFPLQSIPAVRFIFWLRAKLLGARHQPMAAGIVEETLKMGWGKLAYIPGRAIVVGSVTEPWVGEVKFRAIPPDSFRSFQEPGLVKIVWTLESEPLGPELTRFATETRVQPTDEAARRKFKSYWRKFGIGIVLIRLLCVPAMKKAAEAKWRRLQPARTG